MTETVSNKSRQKPEKKAEMSFWEHLEDLRWHVVRSVIAVVVMGVVAFVNRGIIFDGIILAPNSPEFPTNRFFCWISTRFHIGDLCFESLKLKLINYDMAGQFMIHLQISMVAGLVLAVPYIVWEIWRFLMPALKPEEKKYSRGAVLVISLLFSLGVLFGYYVILPLTVNFFGSYYVSDSIANQIALSSFISTVISATVATGLVFELPVIVYFLTKVGLVTPAFLKRTRKYTLVIILVLAAIITPPDVFSQILVGIPLYGLYELSIWVSGKAYQKKELAG